jgi:Acetyltransferase (GNAT) family
MAAPVTESGLTFPMRGERVTVVSTDDGIVVRDRDGTEIGTVQLERMDGNILFIKRLCIEEARRGYGAGTETAQLLLAAAAETAPAVRAWAPPDLGLAVYFWIRMGLRPLHGEGPDGGIWFERAL